MLKSTLLRNVLALLLPATAVLAGATPAQANIRKVQHGSTACAFSGHFIGQPPPAGTPGVPGGDTTADNWVMAFHTSESGSYIKTPHPNTQQSGVEAFLSCSIDRDLPLSTEGLSDLELRFIGAQPPVTAGTTSQDVSCFVYSMRSDGSLAAFAWPDRVSVPPLSVKNTTTVMDLGNAIGATGSKGTIHAKCQMPPEVALWSIYSSEVDGISGN